MKAFFALMFLNAAVFQAAAGEIDQAFVNPSFGGNPNNGAVLLNEANAINKFNAPSTSTGSSSGSAATANPGGDQFSTEVNSLLISELANKLVNRALGLSSTDLPANSTLNTGVNTITIQATGTGTEVPIVNNATGARSVINIPTYY
jgi:curli production assembly/transport component CsgF